MRFAIFGAGGVGGYFGGRLAQAGHDVTFIARGPHRDAIRRDGLTVESIAGDFRVFPAKATDDPASIGPVEAVVVCVKAWQVKEAAARMRPLVGPETLVVPLENGVEAPDELAAVLGPGPVLGGLCKIVSFVRAPGVVRHSGVAPSVAFGEMNGGESERVRRLRAEMRRAKAMDVEEPPDIRVAMWQKFVFIAAVSGVGAVTRAPADVFRAIPETRRLLDAAMRETQAVGRRRGVAIPLHTAERTLAFVDTLPQGSTASMQRDLMAGRPSELEYQTGTVVRLGREAGVPTPVNDFLYAALLPQENRARSIS
ncbi:MAG TPA: 2-dehydropantoate 2-reductase [Thermoanaerobaculia bacterium]|nr:2-dehydropantoate 2-reductase [Thermoanaerobaculia bacterium]